jgi:hypothetical protein
MIKSSESFEKPKKSSLVEVDSALHVVAKFVARREPLNKSRAEILIGRIGSVRLPRDQNEETGLLPSFRCGEHFSVDVSLDRLTSHSPQ